MDSFVPSRDSRRALLVKERAIMRKTNLKLSIEPRIDYAVFLNSLHAELSKRKTLEVIKMILDTGMEMRLGNIAKHGKLVDMLEYLTLYQQKLVAAKQKNLTAKKLKLKIKKLKLKKNLIMIFFLSMNYKKI